MPQAALREEQKHAYKHLPYALWIRKVKLSVRLESVLALSNQSYTP
jgi:hypothetical protein